MNAPSSSGAEKCHRLCAGSGLMFASLHIAFREGDVLGTIATKWTSIRRWPAVFIATLVLALMSVPAHAQQGTYFNFKSVLSDNNANWCMDVPGAAYMPGMQLALANCTGGPDQTFGYENGINLTAGGFCIDGAPPSYAVVLSECDQSSREAWALVP